MMIRRLRIMMNKFVGGRRACQKLDGQEEEQKNSSHDWLRARVAQPSDCVKPLHCRVRRAKSVPYCKRNSCKLLAELHSLDGGAGMLRLNMGVKLFEARLAGPEWCDGTAKRA